MFLFDSWSKIILDGVLSGTKNVLYAAPTSAGKTLVSEIIVANRLSKETKAMLIFPFISLAQEKYNILKVRRFLKLRNNAQLTKQILNSYGGLTQ